MSVTPENCLLQVKIWTLGDDTAWSSAVPVELHATGWGGEGKPSPGQLLAKNFDELIHFLHAASCQFVSLEEIIKHVIPLDLQKQRPI